MARGLSRRGVCAAVLGAGLLFGRPAVAAPPALPIVLTYDAAEGVSIAG